MTHVSTAVIELSSNRRQKTVVVATNRTTELRMKKIAEQKTRSPATARKPVIKAESIRSKVAIFENDRKLNGDGIHNKIIEADDIKITPGKNNKILLKTVEKDESAVIIPSTIVLNTKNKFQRNEAVRTVNVPKKAPSISLEITPWKSSGKIVTDSNGAELEKVLAARRNKLSNTAYDNVVEAKTQVELRQNESKVSKEDPLDISSGEESLRNSAEEESLKVDFPKALDLARYNRKPLWRDISGVIASGITDTLDKDSRIRQEAKFEMMLTEGSFLHQLNTLKQHYMKHLQKHIPQVLTDEDFNILFKHVEDLRLSSESFLNKLDTEWQKHYMLDGIYNVISEHFQDNYQPYIRYCRDMLDMRKHLNELTDSNESFKSLLEVLMNRQSTQRLSLDAFLTAPMQRITKMPLLLKTILEKIEEGTEEYRLCKNALDVTAKVASECDQVVNEKKNFEQLVALSNELEFPSETRTLPIVIKNRHLVSRANVKHFAFRDKAPKKEKLQLILFNDLLLVTKRKGDKQYSVVDYSDRDKIQVKEMENTILLSEVANSKKRNPIVLTMWSSLQEKKLDLIVTFKDAHQAKEWLQMLATEEIHEEDITQLIALKEHTTDNAEELQLSPGDVIQMIGSEIDGWAQGELLSNGKKGRFPMEKVTKITSPRVKAANVKTKRELRSSNNLDDIVPT